MKILMIMALAALQPAARTQLPVAPTAPAPRTGLDSALLGVTDVGTKVAELRSRYELYRRAAFNEPDGAVVQRAEMFRVACQALATSARQAQRRIAPGSLAQNLRTPYSRYRDNLPSVARLGDQCAARTQQLRGRRTEAAAAEAMRADIRNQGNQILSGLQPYEGRLHEVRVVMGWEQNAAAAAPRRGT